MTRHPAPLSLLALLGALCLGAAPAAAQTIWTGDRITFTKAAGADVTDPASRDLLIPDAVELTRGDRRGLFNFALESGFGPGSPADTEWAFPANNAGAAEISAAVFGDLNFDAWATAHGGSGGGPPSTVGQDAVLHIVSRDIYLDIRFLSWAAGSGGGGAFSYTRATPGTVPEPAAALLLAGALAGLALRARCAPH